MVRFCLDCKSRASFGYLNTTDTLYCSKHSKIDMVNLAQPTCVYKGCKTQPCYNFKDLDAIYCKKHAEDGMIDVKNKICFFPNCIKRSTFGYIGGKVQNCKEHKKEGMIDLLNPKCKEDGCMLIPGFGFPGSKPSYCNTHKKEGMVNIRDSKCINSNCSTRPMFGFIGEKATCCFKHKENGMINLRKKKCIFENCQNNAYYRSLSGNKKPTHCKEHAGADMEHVSIKKCEKCNKQPSFNFPGYKTPKFCNLHKEIGMINIGTKKCVTCGIQATFGYAGYNPEYCTTHKLPRMVYRPVSKSKEEDKKCEYCQTIINYKEVFCSGCKIYIELGTTVKGKQKELKIKSLLDENEYKYIYDKKSGESKKRPDFRIPIKNGNIIIEIDEFQHKTKTYSCECEIIRMKEIYLDCEKPNLLFIRYNPDTYKPIGDIKYNNKEREKILLKYLQERIEKNDFFGLNVVYLFFDGFSINSIEIEKISI